jgi:hypothetical protein
MLMSATTQIVKRRSKYSLTPNQERGLKALQVPRVGGERILLRVFAEISDLTVNYTEAEKGRGIPVISKLGNYSTDRPAIYTTMSGLSA